MSCSYRNICAMPGSRVTHGFSKSKMSIFAFPWPRPIIRRTGPAFRAAFWRSEIEPAQAVRKGVASPLIAIWKRHRDNRHGPPRRCPRFLAARDRRWQGPERPTIDVKVVADAVPPQPTNPLPRLPIGSAPTMGVARPLSSRSVLTNRTDSLSGAGGPNGLVVFRQRTLTATVGPRTRALRRCDGECG